MADVSKILTAVVQKALAEVEVRSLPIFTFALRLDTELRSVSVCVDTEDNSRRTVERVNRHNTKHFLAAIRDGNLRAAERWQANVGRSLLLNEFELINLARTKLRSTRHDTAFYRNMAKAVIAHHDAIRALSRDPDRTLLVCSGPDDEVALVWALP